MNKRYLFICFALMLNFYFIAAQDFNSYLIKYKGSPEKIKSDLAKIGVECNKSIDINKFSFAKDNNALLNVSQSQTLNDLSQYYTIPISNFGKLSRIYETLSQDRDFISLEPNYIFRIDKDDVIPNDSLYKQQWWIQAVNSAKAWRTASGKGVIIGLIDTGIDFTHPDLQSNLLVNTKEDINGNGVFDAWAFDETRNGISGDLNGIDEDGNGFVDDVIGYDFVDQSFANFGDYSVPDAVPEDQGEHGTLVAGVMCAIQNNRIGISGIAYNSKLLTAKAFDITGNAESDDIARAIIYAVMNGAKVLNFSFGERNESPIVYDAIKFARAMGCVLVASSGNNGWNYKHYPSDHTEVICVGGIDESGKRFGRANYGSMLDIVAPATSILTTGFGTGGYQVTNGTSLSAPAVSAAAALLLEMNSQLSPQEIKGILQMSAKREFNPTWDVNYGAGILDIGNAVTSEGASIFEIYSPQNEQYVNKTTSPVLVINGVASSSLFDSYDIAIGAGIMPEKWLIETEKVYTQVYEGNLGEINISNLSDGEHTLSLRVYQKNKNVIEKRIYLNITSNNSKVVIDNFEVVNAYYNDKRVIIVGAATDRKCNLLLKYWKQDGEVIKTTRQFDFNTNYHSIVLGEDIETEIDYQGEALFYTSAGDTTIRTFDFRKKGDVFTTNNFIKKSYSLPRTYLLNQVADLYNNGKSHLAVNDLSTLFIRDSQIYEFDNNSFQLKDSSYQGWIAAGIGDSNGDGIPEIFGTADGISTIKQGKTYGENPFGTELFRSSLDSTFWADKIFDLDGDGVDELIGYKFDLMNGNYYAAYKFIDNKYSMLAKTVLPETMKDYALSRGSSIDDFDGDGNYELVFANTRGNLFIYEFSNGKFNLEFLDSTSVASSLQYIEKPDINGDGKPEIMQSYAGSQKLFNLSEVGIPLWTVKLIRSVSPNTYEKEFWSENIYGVKIGASRQGAFFRNGTSVGDLNNDGKDEIVLSAFPNLYVWSFDSTSGTLKPMWYYPSTLSNSAVIFDFDGNGTKEIGISTFSNTSFFEFDSNFKGPDSPRNFEGWAESQTSAFFRWDKVENAEEYVLFYVDRTTNPPQAIEQARTSGTELLLNNLNPDSYYEFVLSCYNANMTDQFSDFSDIVEIFTYPKSFPKAVEVISSESVALRLSGKLANNYISPEYFRFVSSNGLLYSYAKSAIISNDSTIIITLDKKLENGLYKLNNFTFNDYFGNPVAETELSFEYIEPVKADEIYLLNLELISETLVKIRFSEPIDIESAQVAANYKMNPLGKVFYAEVDQTDNQNVLLNLTQEIRNQGSRGRNYTITASNIYSLNGKPITKGAGNTLGFVISKDNLRDVYVYPNPIRQSNNPEIYFANLTNRASITIMTSDGADIITLNETDGNGGVEWNGRDINGNLLPTGIYLFRVNGTNSDGLSVFEETGKFVVLP